MSLAPSCRASFCPLEADTRVFSQHSKLRFIEWVSLLGYCRPLVTAWDPIHASRLAGSLSEHSLVSLLDNSASPCRSTPRLSGDYCVGHDACLRGSTKIPASSSFRITRYTGQQSSDVSQILFPDERTLSRFVGAV